MSFEAFFLSLLVCVCGCVGEGVNFFTPLFVLHLTPGDACPLDLKGYNMLSDSLLCVPCSHSPSLLMYFAGALCTLMAALVTVEQQAGSAATMGLLLSYALQVMRSVLILLCSGRRFFVCL